MSHSSATNTARNCAAGGKVPDYNNMTPQDRDTCKTEYDKLTGKK